MAIEHEGGPIDADKIATASNFIMHAPPGEFNEVFNDVRILLRNDDVLKEGCAKAFAQYNKDQFMPVKVEGSDKMALVTPFNELPEGRFYDPRTARSFKLDHLRKEASDVQAAPQPTDSQRQAEPHRVALQAALDSYAASHYRTGTVGVFVPANESSPTLHCCLEAHQFQPKNYHNGRWRSQWTVVINQSEGKVSLRGLVRVQVHYYEDGNVQLFSSKDIDRKINYISGETALAKEIMKLIAEEESSYHKAINDNYTTMSETTFKALRRQLPITRAKFEWGKFLNYKIGAELKPQ